MPILLFFYDFLFIPLALFFLFFFGLFNRKIRKGLAGRFGNFNRLREKLSHCPAEKKRILFHVSSFGEFLQAKPLMEKLKQHDPELCIIVSVFSPSGYDYIDEKFPVDILCYFPIDGFLVIKKFIETVSPRAAIIVRHDLWPNFLWRLKRNNIPTVLIDSTLPQKSVRYLPVMKQLFRLLFNQLTSILVVSEKEKNHFLKILGKDEKIEIFGDTKYDQVFQRSKFTEKFLSFANYKIFKDKKILVAGSTWPDDEKVLIPAFHVLLKKIADVLLIIAPHEPHSARIGDIQQLCREYGVKCETLSNLQKNGKSSDAQCLIVDMIGVLANIYSLGTAAFVGGSFFAKIHNVLEPAVYGIPVLFGPKMTNSAEAIDLVENGGALIVQNRDQLTDYLKKIFKDGDFAANYGERAKEQVMKNVGSSEKIAQYVLRLMN